MIEPYRMRKKIFAKKERLEKALEDMARREIIEDIELIVVRREIQAKINIIDELIDEFQML